MVVEVVVRAKEKNSFGRKLSFSALSFSKENVIETVSKHLSRQRRITNGHRRSEVCERGGKGHTWAAAMVRGGTCDGMRWVMTCG